MMENVVRQCPDRVAVGMGGDSFDFWNTVSHTLFWPDYHLAESVDNFAPPLPFDLEELDPAGALPPPICANAGLP